MMTVLKEKGVTEIIYMMRVRDTYKYSGLKKFFPSYISLPKSACGSGVALFQKIIQGQHLHPT